METNKATNTVNTDKNTVNSSETAGNVEVIDQEIANFTSPEYEFDFRLGYCQWDLKVQSAVPLKSDEVQVNAKFKRTLLDLRKWAEGREVEDGYSFGMIITKAQAELCDFKPGPYWRAGDIVFGNNPGANHTECYYNPEPIMAIIKPHEKVYRERSYDEKNRETIGQRYYPEPEEVINPGDYLIYQSYLVALLDRDESGKMMLLHKNAMTFGPRRKSGLLFANEIYTPFKSLVAAHYGNHTAPFIFGLALKQKPAIWAKADNPTQAAKVIKMDYKVPPSKEELLKFFVGSEIGKKFEQWFHFYNTNSTPPTVSKNAPKLEELTSEDALSEGFPY